MTRRVAIPIAARIRQETGVTWTESDEAGEAPDEPTRCTAYPVKPDKNATDPPTRARQLWLSETCIEKVRF